MKFTKYLNTIPKWNHQYISYQKLKRRLRVVFSPQVPVPSALVLSSSPVSSIPINSPADFLTILSLEIEKINQFLLVQESELYQRYLYLLSRFKEADFSSPFSSFLYIIPNNNNNNININNNNQNGCPVGMENRSIGNVKELNLMVAYQKAFEDVIKQLADLEQFAKINVWAIQKLLTTYTKKKIKNESSMRRKGSIGETIASNMQNLVIDNTIGGGLLHPNSALTAGLLDKHSLLPKFKNNGSDSNPNSPIVLHEPIGQQQQQPPQYSNISNNNSNNEADQFFNDKVSIIELGHCNNLKKLTLEIEREFSSILQIGLNFLNNPYIGLLSSKEKELSHQVSLLSQYSLSGETNLLKETSVNINRLIEELKIPKDASMWVETIHSCLYKSICMGHLESTLYLFTAYNVLVDLHFRDEVDKQFVHIAAEYGHVAILELLLEKGSDIQSRDYLQRTPLHLAAGGGHSSAVKLLITRGAKLDDVDREHCTPLHLASQTKLPNTSVINLLLNAGANAKAMGPHGRIALHEAAHNKNIQNLTALLTHNVYSKNPIDGSIKYCGEGKETNTSLETMVDIETKDSFGRTALIEACRVGDFESVKLLILMNASVSALDEDRRTGFHEAAAFGSIQTLRMLIGSLNTQGSATPAQYSTSPSSSPRFQSPSKQVSSELMRIINSQDDDGWSALHEAAYLNWVDCVKLLLENGASPFIVDKGEWSPIVHSLYRGNITTAIAIMEYIKTFEISGTESPFSTPSTSLRDSRGLPVPPKVDLARSTDGGVDIPPKTPRSLSGSVSAGLNMSSTQLLASLANVSPSSTSQSTVNLNSSTSSTSSSSSSTSTSSTTKMGGKKVPKSMISNVTFRISASVKKGYRVGVVGNRKALGSWNPIHALFLKELEKANGASGESIWVGKAVVPTHVQLEYKYIICEDTRLEMWETLPENRKFIPEEEDELVNDGVFGQSLSTEEEKKDDQNQKFVERGWLVNDTQVRIRFGEVSPIDLQRKLIQPVVMLDPNSSTQAGRLVVSLKTKTMGNLAGTNPTQITLPCTKDQTITFQTSAIGELATIQFDLYRRGMSTVLVGRATMLASELKQHPYKCVLPIINTSLVTIGELSFFPCIVSPWNHPHISDVLSNVFWKSTLLIGHRGGGAENARSVGKYRRTHIKENTILSFVTAASLGAQYIEFDVQLSKEGVPIIYHDFELPIMSGGPKLPLGRISVSHIPALAPSPSSPSQSHEARVSGNKIKNFRSRSMSDLFVDQLNNNNNSHDSHITSPPQSQPSSSTSTTNIQAKSPPVQQSPSIPLGIGISDTIVPTLEHVFQRVPSHIGFNIELKYPNIEKETELHLNSPERNLYVDTILNVVFEHAGDRPVIFSSFDPDVCIMASLKQPRYPVFFLSNAGFTQHCDPRTNSILEAIRFSKSAHLLGIVTNSRILTEGTPIIGEIKTAGLMLASWGQENNDPTLVDLQETLGVDAVIVDHVSYVARHYHKQ